MHHSWPSPWHSLPLTVSAAAIGSELGSYVDGNGQIILMTRAGLTHAYGVILDIAAHIPEAVVEAPGRFVAEPRCPDPDACIADGWSTTELRWRGVIRP